MFIRQINFKKMRPSFILHFNPIHQNKLDLLSIQINFVKIFAGANKAVHSGFETQRRLHQKSKTGVSVAPQCPPIFFLKKLMIDLLTECPAPQL